MCASDDIKLKSASDVSVPQQVRARSEGYLGHGWEELGERNFSFDSLKS